MVYPPTYLAATVLLLEESDTGNSTPPCHSPLTGLCCCRAQLWTQPPTLAGLLSRSQPTRPPPTLPGPALLHVLCSTCGVMAQYLPQKVEQVLFCKMSSLQVGG